MGKKQKEQAELTPLRAREMLYFRLASEAISRLASVGEDTSELDMRLRKIGALK